VEIERMIGIPTRPGQVERQDAGVVGHVLIR